MTFILQFSVLLLSLFGAFTFQKIVCNNLSQVRCNEKDRETLEMFKEGVIDPSNNLLTWSTQQDCCQWKGVHCDNTTSRVTQLDLSQQFLRGEIKLSLLELQFLYHLNLSYNYFNVISNPPIHNDLIFGSNLHYLDLSNNYISTDNLDWLSQLSSLRYLNLGYTNLRYATNWFRLFIMLPSLSELRLSYCALNITSSLKHVNFTSLVTLDLSGNYFTSKSLRCLFNLSIAISHLDLSGIYLLGNFDLQWLSQLHSLKYLDLNGIDLREEPNWLLAMPPSLSDLHLSNCQLTNISPTLKHVNLTSLVTLDLSFNHFNSQLPHWLLNLSRHLSHLDLSYNSLYGEIPLSLSNYQNLEYLDISGNMFSGSIPFTLVNLTYLEYLDLSGNMFSGSIPFTLGNLSYLVSLSLSSNSFSGIISEMHFFRLHNLQMLDLSYSSFKFHFNPEWIPQFQLKWLYLDDTNQGPQFPPWIYTQKSFSGLSMSSSKVSFIEEEKFRDLIAGVDTDLNLSNNSISGDISNVLLSSNFILLNNNNFTGTLPHLSLEVEYVDLSHNSFIGSIPQGWKNLKYLYFISLWNNNLFGEVLEKLSWSTYLEVINLEKNDFFGTIPNNMSRYLALVILRSNKFEGSIPPQLFLLSRLIHLDLAHNKLSGSIPQIAYNTTQMITDNYSTFIFVQDDNIDFYAKGQVYEYKIDSRRRTIDLSANKISGEIPSELFRLIQVQTLNLSYNHLTGTMPETIGGMKNLESLDLSNNKLFGEIPENMATLSFLSYLNLSCNNFSGQIPIGTQLQSFSVSSYNGNPELCGAPLTKCSMEKNPVNIIQHGINEEGEFDEESLYLVMGIGFVVGFCGLFGSLVIFRKWRHKYDLLLNGVYDKLYVTYMLKFNNLRNREAL